MDIRVTAFHEAGHAVAAEHLQVKLKSITIVPKGDFGGVVHHGDILKHLKKTGDPTDRMRLNAEKAIVIGFAGPNAQKRFDPDSDWEACGASDFKSATRTAEFFFGYGESTTAFLNWLNVRAQELVETEWRLIEFLADELLERKTIDGETATRLIKERRLEHIRAKNAEMATKTLLNLERLRKKAVAFHTPAKDEDSNVS